MSEQDKFLLKVCKLSLGLCASVPLGVVGGGVCGAAILSFNVLLGRSGTTGMRFGDWNPSVAWVGLLYGGFFGVFVTPLAYVFLIRKMGFQKTFWPAVVGTLIGGFAGAVAGPPLAVLTGLSGFFIGVYWATSKISTPKA
jgi:hypothetical protein